MDSLIPTGVLSMKITNKCGAPQPLYDAIKNDPYDKGTDPVDGKRSDFSITELIDSPRVGALKALHPEKLEADVETMRHSLYGQLVHKILERADVKGISSKRFYMNLEIDKASYKISGEIDYYEGGVLQDWKFVSTYKFKGGNVPEEYQAQLNCLAMLMEANGYGVRSLQSVPLYKDFSDASAARGGDYPPTWFEVLDVAKAPSKETLAYLTERVRLHVAARKELPLCSPEERWASDTVYAVMKPGRKTAVRLYPNEAAAHTHVDTEPGLYIDKRVGEARRCKKYCPAASFCVQYQSELKNK